MGKFYKNPLNSLNEARRHFNSLISERENIPYPGGSIDGDGGGMMTAPPGFPGKCCDGGSCISVSFASANDDCSDLNLTECLPGDVCPQQTIDPIDPNLTIDTTGVGSNNMVNCSACQNGYPVSNMFPNPPGCQGQWQDTHLGNPCDDQTDSGCQDEFTINGSASQAAGFPGSFVSNDPTNFLSNMQNGYDQFGCNFFNTVKNKHLDQLANNVFFGPNNPQGHANPGPLWVAQKQSKVTWLTAVLNGPCCNTTTPTGGSVGTNPVLQPKIGMMGGEKAPKGMDRKGMRK